VSNDWDFFFLQVDDQPASIFVDLGIAAEAPISSHPNMAYLRLEMRHPRPDGLSSEEEFDALCALEENLSVSLADACDAIYVGRNTSAGGRDFYFYVPDRVDFDAAAKGAMSRHPDYRWESGIRPDPDWSVYADFLSPSEDDRQRMLNRGVRDALEKHGDDLSIVRDIEHFAYFGSDADAARFAGQMEERGFRITASEQTERGDYIVEFVQREAPSELDETCVEVARMAAVLNGRYDGWGCEVAAPLKG
jgi:hypothetical protein